MEFKDKLRSLRMKEGISQQTLADAIYVSRSAVAKWENGLGLPSQASLQSLCDYFEINKDYFITEEPEKLIVEKNKKFRRLVLTLAATLLILVALLVLIIASIPLVNNGWAAQIENRLLNTPLPENTECVDSLSCAGKLTGNGNGMQYLGAILIQSDRSVEEVNAHYAQYRTNQWEYRVARYTGGRLSFVDHRNLSFNIETGESLEYYIVYTWGESIGIFSELDIRGH